MFYTETIRPTEEVRYLRVVLDDRQSFGAHNKRAAKKAKDSMAELERLMPNIGDPSSDKTAVFSRVTYSILLYRAPVWHDVMKVKTVQRRMLLRECPPNSMHRSYAV
ncbi:hypothetical protein JTB14_017615 [Gonioctena quinquepunctata]|nr:hypothetical protein JTB14_017615 [Gonioctena quinquepunctata]